MNPKYCQTEKKSPLILHLDLGGGLPIVKERGCCQKNPIDHLGEPHAQVYFNAFPRDARCRYYLKKSEKSKSLPVETKSKKGANPVRVRETIHIFNGVRVESGAIA
jgi:hypothetical protein